VFLTLTPEQLQLQNTLRRYFEALITDEIRREIGFFPHSGATAKRLIKQLGDDGWLGIGWPVEFGGQGRPATDEFIFLREAHRAGAPLPPHAIDNVGPLIMAFGSDDQKRRFLPLIVKGELGFAIGYSEAKSGTDLASLQTRAERDEAAGVYIVNGSKSFTSGAEDADWIWLACRTDQDAPPHRGISILLVPSHAPGLSVTPVETVADFGTALTFYDNVRVPISNRVGAENAGWKMITAQLNHERVGIAAMAGRTSRLFGAVVSWAQEQVFAAGQRLIDVPWVRLSLAEALARIDAIELMNWQLVGRIADGVIGPADASVVKVAASEGMIEVYRLLLDVLGADAGIRAFSDDAPLNGEVEAAARQAQLLTFTGGTNEIQRELIARLGLGLPRVPR
jgi:alkylation response protein AidB-like acyl-CoA dehydrogenase